MGWLEEWIGRMAIMAFSLLSLIDCGERGKTVKEINPVLYMHRYDSTAWAVRINQVQRISGRDLFSKRDDYYAIWILIPDTLGTFRGSQIGSVYSQLIPEKIIRTDAFPSEVVTIGGGWITLKGMTNMRGDGKYRVVRVANDPFVQHGWGNKLLEPLPPWQPDSTGR